MPTISTLTVDVASNTSRFRTGITGAVAGLTALAAGAAVAFHQFEESEKLVAQTGAVLKSTGGAANVTAQDVTKLATSLSKTAAVDDELIRNGENVLLTFTNIRNEVGKGNDIFDRATKLTLDLSVAMGQDMKTSAIQVGKALNDPIAGLTSLSRIGVKFTEDTKAQITSLVEHGHALEAQKLILQELSTEFKGSAAAQATSSAAIGVALGELAERIGKLLAPAITFLLDQATALANFLQKNAKPALEAIAETFTNAWNAVKPFAEAIGNVLIPLFETAWHTIQDRLLPAFERIKPLLILIGGAIVVFATVVLAQFALIVTAVSFLVDKFLDFVGFIRDKVVEPVVNFLGRIVDFVLDKVRPIWDVVRDAAVIAWHAILAPIQAVIEKVQTLIGWIRQAIEWLGKLLENEPGGTIGVPGRGGFNPNLPNAQTGGFVARSGLAVIHKGEMFSGVNNEMGFGGFTGDIVLQIDGQTFARVTRDQLLKLGKRNGSTGIP